VPGFEEPCLIRKSDGAFLYATTDLAGIRRRVQKFGAERVVYAVDARQGLHFKLVFGAAGKAGYTTRPGASEPSSLEHAAFGMVLGEDGRPFKTRSGENVKLIDLLDEAIKRSEAVVKEKRSDFSEQRTAEVANAVGIGAVKYADLSKDRVGDYVFSFDKMLALDGNTAPYLQYAHARVKSILRKAGVTVAPGTEMRLEAPHELALAKHIARLAAVVEAVGRDLKPHHLCNYLYELATRFSGFFENCPVIQSEEPVRSSRLVLCTLTARTLEIGLDLLGIEHPDEM